jgi:hypothetical protein
MTGMVLYLSFGLMVVTVISNRYWRRQLAVTRQSVFRMKEAVDRIGRELADLMAAHARMCEQQADAEARVTRAERELQATLLELERKKEAPRDRYYIFDRFENRGGRFWEAAIRHTPLGAFGRSRPGMRRWNGLRRYLLLAENERTARTRLADRFPSVEGFELAEVVPCRLNSLLFNNSAESAALHHLATGDEADRNGDGTRPALRRASLAQRE